MPSPVRTAEAGSLKVRRFPDRAAMGAAAAAEVGAAMRALQETVLPRDRRRRIRMVFAAAPSQAEMLDALVAEPGIDWSRVEAFHMDEYLDLPDGHPARFGVWLDRHLFDRLPFGAVHRIEPGEAAGQTARDYAARLAAAPIDIVCLGIGVNGHLAFNDPPVADFRDPLDVKIVELDEVCRRQQVDDGCFPDFDSVPAYALTLTIPRLLRADRMVCVVPGRAKRDAVRATLHGPLGEACPATALRGHPAATLYLDPESDPDE